MVAELEAVMIEVHEALAEAIVDDTEAHGSKDAEEVVDTSAALNPASMGGRFPGIGPEGGAAPAGTGGCGVPGGMGVLGGFAGS